MTDQELEQLSARREVGIRAKARIARLEQTMRDFSETKVLQFEFGERLVVRATSRLDAAPLPVCTLREEDGLGPAIRAALHDILQQRLDEAKQAFSEA